MGELLESVREIRAFAEAMPSLEEIITGVGSGEVVEYDCEDGFCIGFYLYQKSPIRVASFAVQRAVMSSGATLARHQHTETEVLVVCHGCLSIRFEEEVEPVIVEAPGMIQIEPERPHTVTALEITHSVGITIPSSPGYPASGARD